MELVDRVESGNFLAVEHQNNLRDYEKMKRDVIQKRVEVQQLLENRAARLRRVAAESAPQVRTGVAEDLEGVCREHLMLEKLLSKGPCQPPRDRSRSSRRRMDTRPTFQDHLPRTCRFANRCNNRHGPALGAETLRPLCCYFQQGRCRFGSACNFSHETSCRERRACQFGADCRLGHGSFFVTRSLANF